MTQLHIEIIGQGSPLILLHGWGWNSAVWRPLLPQLVQNYQVFLVDLPGFGKSPLLTKDYTLENIAEAIFACTPEKSSWLGWSLGGLIASWVAIYFPEKVERLITVASSPRFVCDDDWPGVELDTLEKFSRFLQEDHKKTLLDFLELQLRGSQKQEELFALLQDQVSGESVAMEALQAGLKLLRETDLRASLEKIRCPSLHIFGNRDTLIPVQVAELLQTMMPNSKSHVVKRSGHMPFLVDDEFIELLK